jgi:hypothetical protein
MLGASMLSGQRQPQRWVGALTLGLAAGGCYQGFDPFDPEVLEAVMRGRGDAEGLDRSGIYGGGEMTVLECGCRDTGAAVDVSLCTRLELAEAVGLPLPFDVELVQADGAVRIQALGGDGGSLGQEVPLVPTYYGSLWADGRLRAAAMLEADALVAQGQVLGRIDGTLLPTPDGWQLEVQYQQRYVLDLVVGNEALDFGFLGGVESVAVDCRERLALDLRWLGPIVPGQR